MTSHQTYRSGIAIAAKMRSGGPMRNKHKSIDSGKNYHREYLKEIEMNCVHAFVYKGNDNWKISPIEDWDFDLIELDGSEMTLGHRQLDGSICKIVQGPIGQIIAIIK